MSLLLYSGILLNISLSFVHHLIYLFNISFVYTKDNPTLEDNVYRSINNVPIPVYPKKIQVTFSEENRSPPTHLSKNLNKKTTLNLNITSYFLYILASPDVLTCLTTGTLITKTIKYLGLTKYHQKHYKERCI